MRRFEVSISTAAALAWIIGTLALGIGFVIDRSRAPVTKSPEGFECVCKEVKDE